jgi:hypothetical protein
LKNKKSVHLADNKQDTERCEFHVLKTTTNLGVFDIMLFLNLYMLYMLHHLTDEEMKPIFYLCWNGAHDTTI